jgi:hypothetical protein
LEGNGNDGDESVEDSEVSVMIFRCFWYRAILRVPDPENRGCGVSVTRKAHGPAQFGFLFFVFLVVIEAEMIDSDLWSDGPVESFRQREARWAERLDEGDSFVSGFWRRSE